MFNALAQQWDTALTQGVSAVVTSGLATVNSQMTVILTLWVIILGGLLSFSKLSWPEFSSYMVRTGIVIAFLVAANYQNWVVQPLLVDVPNLITQAVGGVGAAQGGGPFNALADAVTRQEAKILAQATGITMIGERLGCYVVSWGALLLVTGLFCLFEFSRSMLALTVCLIVFCIPSFLFESTKNVGLAAAMQAAGWCGTMLLLAITVSLVLALDQAFIDQAMMTGEVDVMLNAELHMAIAILFGLAVTLAVPSVARAVFGSAISSFHPAVFGAGRAGAAAARLAGRATARAIQRMRRR